eukprot:GHVL01038836.1.p1 GENE.GHVL01038836.1~~GHVL01038836.1.p1  ORF type:complete len:347 (+),score=41.43 GHVL01038836.1:128-1042(+)
MLMNFTYILIFFSCSILYIINNVFQKNPKNNVIKNENNLKNINIYQYCKKVILPSGIIGILTFEGNVLTFSSMSYTSMLSVTLLGCSSIPMVFFLSYWILKYTFFFRHYISIVVCAIGFIFMILADSSVAPTIDSRNSLYGDFLCLAAAAIYTISDIGEEMLLENVPIIEFLIWMSLIAIISSAIQTLIWFQNDFSILYDCFMSSVSIKYFILASLSQWAFDIMTPLAIMKGGASLYNLSLLSCQVYSAIVSYYIFSDPLHWSYTINMVLIIGGLIVYHTTPVMKTSVNNSTMLSPLLDESYPC